MIKIPNKLEPATRAERIAAGEKIEPETREEIFKINARLGGDFVVNISSESGGLTADKTYEEIASADEDGQSIRLVYNANRFVLSVCDEAKAQFTHVRWTGNKARLISVSILPDGTVTENMADFNPSSIPG